MKTTYNKYMRSLTGKPKGCYGSLLQASVSGEGNEVVFLEMQSESAWFAKCLLFTQQPLDSADMLSEGSEAD